MILKAANLKYSSVNKKRFNVYIQCVMDHHTKLLIKKRWGDGCTLLVSASRTCVNLKKDCCLVTTSSRKNLLVIAMY